MSTINRRTLLGTGAALAAAGVTPAFAAMPQEGPDTPKLTMYIQDPMDEAEMRRLKQVGINHVDIGNMRGQPWSEEYLRGMVDSLKKGGLELGIVMTRWSLDGGMDPGMSKIVYATPDRDQEIARFKQSIVNAGKVGIPVIEYNFYNHRAVEGYKEIPGRGGSGLSDFNYERMKDLPPIPSEGVHTHEQTWKNLEYFLKEVVPVAEKAGVRLSLHPNDPPSPMSRGSQQVMNSLADWKRLIAVVDSPSNCLTYDCGVTREIGEDPVAVANYFASRDRIGQVHFRNVIMRTPRLDYTEVAPDEGDNDMFAVMKALVDNKYKLLIMPEHPRGLDADKMLGRGWGGYTGWAYNIAYAKAMLQVALMQRGRR